MKRERLSAIAPVDACNCSSIWEIAAVWVIGRSQDPTQIHDSRLSDMVVLTVVYISAQASDQTRGGDGCDHS